jgi:capsular exopolysaccharide synthesis family protein
MSRNPGAHVPTEVPVLKPLALRPTPLEVSQPAILSLAPEDKSAAAVLPYYWLILKRYRATWIVFTLLGLVLGVLVAIPQTPVYRARGSIEIVDFNDNFLNLKRASPVAESNANTDWDIQTEIKILQSDALRDRVVKRLLRNVRPQASAKSLTTWRKSLNLSALPVEDVSEKTIRDAVDTIKVRASGQTRILEISADSTDPEVCRKVVNTLADEFIEQSLEARSSLNQRTSEWLGRELDDVRAKLERSEDALHKYAKMSGLLFTDEKTSAAEDKLQQVEEELAKAQANRIEKQARYDLARDTPAERLPEVLNDPGQKATEAKLVDLRQQLVDLRQTFTPEHPKVKRVEAQINMLEGVMQSDRQSILSKIDSEYREAQAREKLLGAAYAEQARSVTSDSEKAIQYNILKREVDTNRQLYDAMLQQMKESSIASAMRASNIRVLDAAKLPLRPYRPNLRHSGAFGLLCGFVLGAAFILIRDRMDSTIQKPGDSANYLNIPELGVIPTSGPVRRTAKLTSATSQVRSISVAGERLELSTWRSKQSLIAESFRSILISILFSTENTLSSKLLVLTSSSPGEGKSTVASNLAIALAEAGKRVLLIDADMRRPRQHDIFSVENRRGMSTLLRERGEAVDTQSVDGMIRETEIPRLWLMTSGPATTLAANLLCNAVLPELLTYLRSEFDVVLIDTPPMLQMPDARILGRLADGIVLVIRAGQTTRHAAMAARQRFQQDGIRVLGTILNGWNPDDSPIGYYGYHRDEPQGAIEDQPQPIETW